MSSSYLWVMNEECVGEKLVEFYNANLFSPFVYELMYGKYLPNEKNERKEHYITATMVDPTFESRLNVKVGNSQIQEDRIVWAFARHTVFFTKDKVLVADAIKKFLTSNKDFADEDFSKRLGTHIYERFQEVANEILKLNEKTQPYFIFETSNSDCYLPNWFQVYDEIVDDCFPQTLKDVEENVTSFALFENNQLEGFVPNTEFSYTSNQL